MNQSKCRGVIYEPVDQGGHFFEKWGLAWHRDKESIAHIEDRNVM